VRLSEIFPTGYTLCSDIGTNLPQHYYVTHVLSIFAFSLLGFADYGFDTSARVLERDQQYAPLLFRS